MKPRLKSCVVAEVQARAGERVTTLRRRNADLADFDRFVLICLDGTRARRIFLDREDKQFFLELLSRHLRPEPATDARSRPFQHLRAMITLCAFNVMGTHFHLIIWQHDERGIAELTDRVKSAYSRYFNKKYGNTAPLFNGPVRAKPIDSRAYFRWLVGYVHDNHRDGIDYEFSSHRAWLDSDHCPSWLDPEPGARVFGGLDNYRNSWRRYGFGDEDFVRGGSERLCDAMVIHGNESAVLTSIAEHRDAGASHVCLQVLGADLAAPPLEEWRRIAGALYS